MIIKYECNAPEYLCEKINEEINKLFYHLKSDIIIKGYFYDNVNINYKIHILFETINEEKVITIV